MRKITLGVVLLTAACAVSSITAGEPPRGVAGVDVILKQNPKKRVVTDARGSFAFDALPAGSHILTFRARKANDVQSTTTSKVTIATSYSIKVEGTKRGVNQTGLTSDKFASGVDVPIEVGAGSKVRGQVLAAGMKKMVWIAPEIGSHMPGHWVDADSKEASMFNRQRVSTDDVRNNMRPADPHQEGFGGR